jgi:signal transduction histidine kinase
VYIARSDKDVPERVKEQLDLAEQELKRAGQITHSTLTYYRESPTPVQTDPTELVEGVLTLQQGALRKARVQLEKDLVRSQDIQAFPGELRQIFTNLISNAVEAMQPNGRLIVRVHPACDWKTGRDGYRILVADTGPGIPAEARKKLFTAFYTTKGEQGTGLGLWITRQLVQKHGGFLKFRSRSRMPHHEGGTVFSVWLPLKHEFATSVNSHTAA